MAGMNMGGSAVGVPPPVVVLFGGLGASNTTTDLYSIDQDTGAATSIGACGFGLTGLSFRPSDGVLFGITNNNSAANHRSIITIDPVTGTGTLVGATGVTGGMSDISFRSDDVLFGYGATTHRLYTINTGSGTATQVSATPVAAASFGNGLAFNSVDVLYLFSGGDIGFTGDYYIVDDTTAVGTLQGPLSGFSAPGGGSINAAGFDAADQCWVIDNGQTTPNTYLATIDVGTSVVTSVGLTTFQMDALAVQT